MAKQVILIILLSVATIMFKAQLSYMLDIGVYAHNEIARSLQLVFADDQLGRLIQDMLALLALPIASGVVAGAAYWMVKRTQMPHSMIIVWVVWLVLLVTLLAQHRTQPPMVPPIVKQTQVPIQPLSKVPQGAI